MTRFSRVAPICTICTLSTVVVIQLHLTHHAALSVLCAEDGLSESLQFAFLVTAGVRFWACAHRQQGWARCTALLFSALCCFVAGEEISWGQRVFSVVTPSYLAAINVQGETNLHNIDGVLRIVRIVGIMGIAGLFVGFPLALPHSDFLKHQCRRFGIPVFPLSALAVPVVSLAFLAVPRLVWRPRAAYHEIIFNFDEVGELFFAGSLLILAVTALLRSASLHRSEHVSSPPSRQALA